MMFELLNYPPLYALTLSARVELKQFFSGSSSRWDSLWLLLEKHLSFRSSSSSSSSSSCTFRMETYPPMMLLLLLDGLSRFLPCLTDLWLEIDFWSLGRLYADRPARLFSCASACLFLFLVMLWVSSMPSCCGKLLRIVLWSSSLGYWTFYPIPYFLLFLISSRTPPSSDWSLYSSIWVSLFRSLITLVPYFFERALGRIWFSALCCLLYYEMPFDDF